MNKEYGVYTGLHYKNNYKEIDDFTEAYHTFDILSERKLKLYRGSSRKLEFLDMQEGQFVSYDRNNNSFSGIELSQVPDEIIYQVVIAYLNEVAEYEKLKISNVELAIAASPRIKFVYGFLTKIMKEKRVSDLMQKKRIDDIEETINQQNEENTLNKVNKEYFDFLYNRFKFQNNKSNIKIEMLKYIQHNLSLYFNEIENEQDQPEKSSEKR